MDVKLQKIGSADDLEILIDRYPFVIGRRSGNDCCLPLACISRRHCQLTREAGEVLVQDLESHNGTFVNGRRALKPLPLQHGDELSLGPVQFRVLVQADCQETDQHLEGTRCESTEEHVCESQPVPRPTPL
jgi:pSer/pThr/pTyr-binding forkhead associated (FHA) protein